MDAARKSAFERILGFKTRNWTFAKLCCLFIVGLRKFTTIDFCDEELGISSHTTVDWNNFLREVCAWRLLQTPTVIGGTGLHVEIDETLISRRKNHTGRILPQQWIFGGICRETKEIFMYAVPDRSKETLENAIRASVAPGSIIISDMWSSYIGIEELLGMNYTHQTVNHSQNFVNPARGEHTQTIESLWHTFKMRNKRECGTHRAMVDSYLCQFMWRMKFCGLNCLTKYYLTSLNSILLGEILNINSNWISANFSFSTVAGAFYKRSHISFFQAYSLHSAPVFSLKLTFCLSNFPLFFSNYLTCCIEEKID